MASINEKSAWNEQDIRFARLPPSITQNIRLRLMKKGTSNYMDLFIGEGSFERLNSRDESQGSCIGPNVNNRV